MAGKLRFDVELGTAPRAAARKSDEDPLRILVLADLSGRDAGSRASLVGRRIARIDIDDFDRVFADLAPAVNVDVPPGRSLDVRFESLDDFHPDSLYRRLDTFASLRDLRERLGDPARFAQAVSELMATGAAPAAAEDNPTAETAGDLAERLLGGARPAEHATGGTRIDALIRRMVEPHVVRDPTAGAGPYLAAIDAAAGDLMRSVLSDARLSALESSWRAVRWLVETLELGETMILSVLDVSRAELLADLVAADVPLNESAVYRRLVEGLEGAHPSLIVADIAVSPEGCDLELLARLGAIGARLGAPVLAAARPGFAGVASLAQQPDPRDWPDLPSEQAEIWQTLRASGVAPWIGLALPRILLRQPYGATSDEIEAFPFEELAGEEDHERLLWGNPAYACALLIASSFAARGWSMEPGDDLDIGDLPTVMRQVDGDASMQPCAEIVLGERGIEALLALGLTPFVSHRSRNACRLARFQSIAEPPHALAWPGGR
jgi:type VI secretion system protein ImpC